MQSIDSSIQLIWGTFLPSLSLSLSLTLSFTQEKELLRKKKEEIEEDERARRNKVVMTFDLVGRKVIYLHLLDYPFM